MRGKAEPRRILYDKLGITPAYAGKSFGVPLLDSGIKDHPRLCGEKLVALMEYVPQIGSPPPMRGKAKNLSF